MQPARLMVYDATCAGSRWLPGLSRAWRTGGTLYRTLGRIDAWRGFANWRDALDWLLETDPSRPIGEVQYWGHGTWGRVWLAGESLDIAALERGHAHYDRLAALRDRLTPDALVWFRTCETFGTRAGHTFARAWVDFFGRRAAGHTYVIGALQSGLHSLGPGEVPNWSADEGIPPGVAKPSTALGSSWSAPNTITCFHGAVPDGY